MPNTIPAAGDAMPRITLEEMIARYLADLPLKFHPAAIRASAVFEPPQVSGPSEARVFRLHSGRRAG